MERLHTGISGSHGFVGRQLAERLTNWEPLDRSGVIPEGVNMVFDLATYGNLASQEQDARKIYDANLNRLFNSFTNPDTSFIYISTSSVTRPIQTLYSASKKAGEEFVKLKAQEGYKVAIVRPGTVIGVNEQREHLIPTLIRSCLEEEKMPFIGWPTHDYIDVGDFVEALLYIPEKGILNGETYEIAAGVAVSNLEVKDIVEKVTGKKANIREVESMRDYDDKQWVLNTERIRSLGWEPKKTLEQSVKEMVDNTKHMA